MLDAHYMNGVDKYIDNENYIVWKFSASEDAYEKQKRPLVYSYSLMTRAYGTWFNEENLIDYFTKEGFDVYLVDWGTNQLFTLPGWTMDHIADVMENKVIMPLLEAYKVDRLNLFCVCIGGAILSYMLEKKPELSRHIHRMAYYGVPIFGDRDLGVEKSFKKLYAGMSPWQNLWPVRNTGFSLLFLDLLLLSSVSLSMLQWSWEEFFKERKNNSFMNTVFWTFDDRWVPVPALMGIMEQAFVDKKEDKKKEKYFHLHPKTETSGIHFLNIVGDSDMLVKPSASIVDYNSAFPNRFKSFQQLILGTGHFMFAEPGLTKEKKDISQWFAGYGVSDLCYKIGKNMDRRFADRASEIFESSFESFFEAATDDERENLISKINRLLANESKVSEKNKLTEQLSASVSSDKSPEFFETLTREISPLLWTSDRR